MQDRRHIEIKIIVTADPPEFTQIAHGPDDDTSDFNELEMVLTKKLMTALHQLPKGQRYSARMSVRHTDRFGRTIPGGD